MKDRRRVTPPLNYATPPPSDRDGDSEIALAFGVLAAVFGLIALCLGMMGIVWLVRDWNHVDRQDIMGVMVCNLIWVVCAWAAYRWIPPSEGEE